MSDRVEDMRASLEEQSAEGLAASIVREFLEEVADVAATCSDFLEWWTRRARADGNVFGDSDVQQAVRIWHQAAGPGAHDSDGGEATTAEKLEEIVAAMITRGLLLGGRPAQWLQRENSALLHENRRLRQQLQSIGGDGTADVVAHLRSALAAARAEAEALRHRVAELEVRSSGHVKAGDHAIKAGSLASEAEGASLVLDAGAGGAEADFTDRCDETAPVAQARSFGRAEAVDHAIQAGSSGPEAEGASMVLGECVRGAEAGTSDHGEEESQKSQARSSGRAEAADHAIQTEMSDRSAEGACQVLVQHACGAQAEPYKEEATEEREMRLTTEARSSVRGASVVLDECACGAQGDASEHCEQGAASTKEEYVAAPASAAACSGQGEVSPKLIDVEAKAHSHEEVQEPNLMGSCEKGAPPEREAEERENGEDEACIDAAYADGPTLTSARLAEECDIPRASLHGLAQATDVAIGTAASEDKLRLLREELQYWQRRCSHMEAAAQKRKLCALCGDLAETTEDDAKAKRSIQELIFQIEQDNSAEVERLRAHVAALKHELDAGNGVRSGTTSAKSSASAPHNPGLKSFGAQLFGRGAVGNRRLSEGSVPTGRRQRSSQQQQQRQQRQQRQQQQQHQTKDRAWMDAEPSTGCWHCHACSEVNPDDWTVPWQSRRCFACGAPPSSAGRGSSRAASAGAVARQPEQHRRISLMKCGTRVRAFGLWTWPQLNGKEGTCEHWDPQKERWHVRFANGEVKALRRDNLQEL